MSIIVDNFAGGGGASLGIESALGRSVDYAINHDPEAIAMHRANHPATRHFCESVWDVDPVTLAHGRAVELGWFSPDCTFHSKARGGQPFRDRDRARRRRGLAWLVVRWAKAVRPRIIMLENVEEFAHWGPLLPDGKPCPARRGMTFRRWHRQIENLGYRIDMRELRACDYGAPTTRKRLFVIARCDGGEVVFPPASHGTFTGALPYRTAAECIDWSAPCPSIFGRKKPLADATLRRIARGIMRYVVNAPRPFIVPVTHPSDVRVHGVDEPFRTITGAHRGELALVAAFLARHYGGHENDGSALDVPMHTVTARDHHALVAAYVLKYYGSGVGSDVHEPLHTITAGAEHFATVAAFLTKFRTGSVGCPLDAPMPTVTANSYVKRPGGAAPIGLVTVTVGGEQYAIVDIGMRMLTPRELFNAQSFPSDYIIDPNINGKPLTKTAQIRCVGNSVPPVVAEALVRANVLEQREREEQVP